LDWGNTAGILRHQLVVNYLYALPFGRGRRFLANSNSAVNALVGGWQASGITTYLGGGPSSVSFSVPSNYVGWIGGRADRIAGVPLYKKGSGHNIVAGVPWFNPAAFGPPSPWTWGNSAKGLIWGPGSWNWDISASKEIPIHDTVHMIVRADFLDAFNHMNLSGINTTVSSTTYGGSAIPLAGYLTSGSGNRYIQVSARISF
jgi:hypothetical protein